MRTKQETQMWITAPTMERAIEKARRFLSKNASRFYAARILKVSNHGTIDA
jgi:hypothetical protein